MTDLGIEIAGIRLKNPTILASGVLGETGESLLRVGRSGAGAVTTKSIGLEPRQGHDNPTVVELESGMLNAIGLANPGIGEFGPELDIAAESGVPVIVSIFGKDELEFAELAQRAARHRIAALELNLSCPHATGYGSELGCDPAMVGKVTRAVKEVVPLPVFVKLTPNTSDIVALGKAAVAAGCQALVAINTVKAIAINPEAGRAVLSNIYGGYSGPGIKPIGLRCVFQLASAELGVPIIGVGGITTGRDVAEYLMAGASAVQIGTAVREDGPQAFQRVVSELGAFMKANGFGTVGEMVGLALKRTRAM